MIFFFWVKNLEMRVFYLDESVREMRLFCWGAGEVDGKSREVKLMNSDVMIGLDLKLCRFGK